MELLILEDHLEALVNKRSNGTGSEGHAIVYPGSTSALWAALVIAMLQGAIWGTGYYF